MNAFLNAHAASPLQVSVLLLTVACHAGPQDGDRVASPWQGSRVESGDTVTVRTTAGSVWQGDGKLIEEAAIGTETRGADDLLGDVVAIDATADRIFIADGILKTVRVYDMAGSHVTDIGREGGGPGEFRSVVYVAIDRLRGELVVRQANGRLHRFSLSGEYRGTLTPRMNGALYGGAWPLLQVTRDGVTLIFHFVIRRYPGSSRPVRQETALLAVDSTGTLTDTLDVPYAPFDDPDMLKAIVGSDGTFRPEPVPFSAHDYWNVTRDGALIRGNSGEYGFEIRYRDGRRTIIERAVEPEPVLPEERDAAERRVYGILRDFQPGWAWNGPEIPETKAFYSGIIPDRSGRIWILREGKGRRVGGWMEPDGWREWERNPEWVSDRWFEVFEEASGRYLGRVDVPAGFDPEPQPFIEGDTFICLTEDEEGRPVVRRYRLQMPDSGTASLR